AWVRSVPLQPSIGLGHDHRGKVSMARIGLSVAGGLILSLGLSAATQAQVSEQTMQSISTPDKVESRLGPLEFNDGVPSKITAEKVYDNLDFTYAYRAFMDNMRGVSIHAFRKGLQSVGVKDNEVIVFSELMDAKS